MSQINLNCIQADLPPPMPGYTKWETVSKGAAAKLKTEEDRFQFYHMDQVYEEMFSLGASEAIMDAFLYLNAGNLEQSIETGKPFRLSTPDPVVWAFLAMRHNMNGPFVRPPKCERFARTVVWDRDNPLEVIEARSLFDQLVREKFKPVGPFDEQKESATLKGYRIHKEEKHYLSVMGMYKEGLSLRTFLSKSPEERKDHFYE